LHEIAVRLDHLTAWPPGATSRTLNGRVLLRHDCGHEDVGYAMDGDGRTECHACYAKRWPQ
jgi:hypothetical protein